MVTDVSEGTAACIFSVGQIIFYCGDGPNGCLRRPATYFLKCTALHILFTAINTSKFNVFGDSVLI